MMGINLKQRTGDICANIGITKQALLKFRILYIFQNNEIYFEKELADSWSKKSSAKPTTYQVQVNLYLHDQVILLRVIFVSKLKCYNV